MKLLPSRISVSISSTFPSSDTAISPGPPSHTITHRRAQSAENQSIIIGSILGGIALALICLTILLYPIWRRRHHPHRPSGTSTRNPASCLSKPCRASSPLPRPSGVINLHMVRPVTPSPHRLALDASSPFAAAAAPHPFSKVVSMRWDVEKASVHTPSGHPADIAWRGNIFGNRSEEDPQARQPEPSISSTFAAEMSSILESISIKSSYSSLRSSGAVLGVPARLQTPLSVQKLRQDSCATTVGGATRASVSDSGGSTAGPCSLSRVPSPSSPEKSQSRIDK